MQQNNIPNDGRQRDLTSLRIQRSRPLDELELLNYLITRNEHVREEYRNSECDQGPRAEIITQFTVFLADESLAGNKCGICLEFIEVGRRMMRLYCNGQHVFCKACIEKWFAEHISCPNCRHKF